jgi:4-amino-4-deoxy-L-arabinose transferase-like glycosyltransferase
MTQFVSRISVSGLLIICALCIVPGIGLYDFSTRGEGREALMVKDIVERGEWFLPRGYGDRINTKPPAFHWTAAATSIVSGSISEFTIRFPSALFSALCLGLFLFLLRKDLGPNAQWIFIGTLLLCVEWLRASITARVDMVHAASLSSALLTAFFAVKTREYRFWIFTTLLLTVAILGKGPVALLIAGPVVGFWILLKGESKISSLAALFFTCLVSFCMAALWYYGAYLKAPEEFWAFFHYENIARFMSTMEDSPHSHSVFYLFAVFLLGLLPWTPLVLFLIYKHTPRSLVGLKRAVFRGDTLVTYSLIVIAAIFVFYSIPTGKRAVYLLAAYPFIALATARILEQHQLSPKGLRIFKLIAISICAITLLAQTIVRPFFIAPKSSERKLAQTIIALRKPEATVLSYGFEFYGASFYSGLKMHGLPVDGDIAVFTLEQHPPLKQDDLVVYYENNFETLAKELKVEAFDKQVVAGPIKIGKRNVYVAKLISKS